MKDILKYLVSHLVDFPDEVTIDEIPIENNNLNFVIHANQSDIGKIIGKEGKIIQSLRNVIKILAIKEGKQVRLEVM